MTIKTILNVIGVDQSDSDLKLAIELCRQVNAHLAVLVLSIAVSPPPVGEYAPVMIAAWADERQDEIHRLQRRVKEVSALLAKTGLSGEADGEHLERTWINEVVGRRGRYADLIVIGPDLAADESLKTIVLKGSLYEAQIPALLIPKGESATLQPQRVLLSWDGGLEAARAAREALPLLAGAAEVRVTMVDPHASENGNAIEPGADIAAYLTRHGAKVMVDRLPSGDRPVADILRSHAVDIAADMIIMGAYSHSRLRERIFGGTTRSMIDESEVPVFMAR